MIGKKKKLRTRTKFTMFSMINIIWYTIANLILAYYEKEVPDALTIAWFGAWTVELGLLFGIKIKDKQSD